MQSCIGACIILELLDLHLQNAIDGHTYSLLTYSRYSCLMIVADVDNNTGESGNKENVMKKKKIALISDEVDFVRGKKNVEGKTKKIKTDSDNIFVSISNTRSF